jgi:hypothetical protein
LFVPFQIPKLKQDTPVSSLLVVRKKKMWKIGCDSLDAFSNYMKALMKRMITYLLLHTKEIKREGGMTTYK